MFGELARACAHVWDIARDMLSISGCQGLVASAVDAQPGSRAPRLPAGPDPVTASIVKDYEGFALERNNKCVPSIRVTYGRVS